MTYRHVISCGLIAGLDRNEMDRMRPGEILDLYVYRRKYDQARSAEVMAWLR